MLYFCRNCCYTNQIKICLFAPFIRSKGAVITLAKYFLKRLLLLIPTLLLVMLVVFLLVYNLTGTNTDEIRAFADGDSLDQFFIRINAGENAITKFVRYIYDLVTKGTFGRSSGIDLDEMLIPRMKTTLLLALLGFLVSFIIGIPAGIYCAYRHNGTVDRILSFLTLLLSSIPSFCLALLLCLLFFMKLNILPVTGLSSWKHYVMPTLVLCGGGIAITTRMTRSAVLEILNKQYVTTLRAKGLREWKIVFVHVLKNALIPITSVLNNVAISVLCSTLIVENFFTIPGIGRLVIQSVSNRNPHMLLGCVLFLAAVICVITIITDFCYMAVSPQMRAQYKRKGRAGKSAKGGLAQ